MQPSSGSVRQNHVRGQRADLVAQRLELSGDPLLMCLSVNNRRQVALDQLVPEVLLPLNDVADTPVSRPNSHHITHHFYSFTCH